jgi:dolichol-phosphate mannosyltransferase
MSIENIVEKDKKNLVIIPTYNERENIGPLIKHIMLTVEGTDIVVVDDDSPDGTAGEVKSLQSSAGEHESRIMLIERKEGGAYQAGLQYGLNRGYRVLITMDADHSHNPLHLPAILTAIEENDVVIGSRYIRDGGTINWRIRRILLSWLANRFARFILHLQGRDLTSGYRAYRREILEKIGLDQVRSNGYSYLVEMLFRAQQNGARVKEVPIIFYDRTMGNSKISRKEIYRGVITLIRLRLTSKRLRNIPRDLK